ncbi:ParB/RepB/Spo0J family plasmid partition protein [Gilliamella sp. B2969]|uniref:ParB/RepB/Spo0J family plasmid partition protein n=1 Tax=Gilliamella sp. B2969 TaxID=2818021 RepID=UPI00226A4E95|nr:ParB/RepB/Spo0J family plasmid partition protein [Gilliamella sp. B2969]MCX8731242.1 ParB/RepB/Spo0J family plasmid partition protein [Gilliamella sp. B2969]
MKHAPKINFDNTEQTATTTAPVSRNTTPTVANLSRRVANIAPGNTIILSVLGRDVTLTCKTIAAEFVDKKTMVYSDNIRLQELLDADSLADILPTMSKSGQQFPAIGRDINGVIEIADGSRRRKAAILANRDYMVLVGDLTDKEMNYLSDTGNEHQKPSAYELGMQYKRRLHREFCDNLTHLADDLKMDRKTVRNYIETATLPIEIIKCFKSPNEISLRAGVRLAKLYQQHADAMMMTATEIIKNKKQLTTEDVFSKLESVQPLTEQPTERKFGSGITAKYKNNTVTFSLKNAPADLIKQIEQILEKNNESNKN